MHRAQLLSDIVGNDSAIRLLRAFADAVSKNMHPKPVLVYGPSGTGKTAAVLALANEYGWNVIEMNAGDYRDSDALNERLMPAANSKSIFGKTNLIFMDEIDELAARFDNGASVVLLKLIKEAKNPIIFTANDAWDKKIAFLRNAVDKIEFKKVDKGSISALLEKIANKEKINASRDIIDAIAARADGDVRSAINDLYAVAGSEDSDVLYYLGMRNRKNDIFSALDKIFFSSTFSAPIIEAGSVDLEADMLAKWIDENIPARYMAMKDKEAAFNNLSLSTIYAYRASRLQQYILLRYMTALMSAGVALAKTEYPSKEERYRFPKVVKMLSASKTGRVSKKDIAAKMQKRINESTKRIANEVMPLIAKIISLAKDDKERKAAYEFFENAYSLTEKEVKAIAEDF